MSWRSHGHDNDSLVNALHRNGIFKSPAVDKAMRKIDRALFVPQDGSPYEDAPQRLSHQATISAPHMHAHCLELLADKLVPGARVLDIGSGTGYLTAVFAEMVGGTGADGTPGVVVGVEHIAELADRSLVDIARSAAGPMLKSGGIKILAADGRLGHEPEAPYDAIHVGAAAPQVPKALLEQLAPGGRLVIPVGSEMQELMLIDKAADGSLNYKAAMGVRYVPLTTRDKQLAAGYW